MGIKINWEISLRQKIQIWGSNGEAVGYNIDQVGLGINGFHAFPNKLYRSIEFIVLLQFWGELKRRR